MFQAMGTDLLIYGSSTALVVVLALLWHWGVHSQQRYPRSGPVGWPFIGNLFQLPLIHPWLRLAEWKESYGPLVYLHGLGNSILVLNDIKTVNDLLERRGTIYSHRPTFTVVGELMGLDQGMPLHPYGSVWKLHRKLAYSALSPEAVKRYHLLQEDAAAILNRSLCETRASVCDEIRLAAGRIILSVTYGLPVHSYDDEYITHAEKTMNLITKSTVPGAHLADIFPILKPLHAWLFFNQVETGRRMILDLVSKPFHHVKLQMGAGTAMPSLTNHLLSEFIHDPDFINREDYEHTVKWMTGALYGAGAETTYSTVLTAMIAMIKHPDKQSRAQEEIDAVVGVHKLPTINDKDSLPYVNAFIKETMRWYPALPLSIARRTARADEYEGHHIPAGTTVIPNVWSIANDCDSPRDFLPERFLQPNHPVDPAAYAFGFGRRYIPPFVKSPCLPATYRVCPGRYLAENSVFIIVAGLLAAFDISPEIDDQGRTCPLQPQFSSGLVSYPLPFKCTIRPRSRERRQQVLERASAALL